MVLFTKFFYHTQARETHKKYHFCYSLLFVLSHTIYIESSTNLSKLLMTSIALGVSSAALLLAGAAEMASFTGEESVKDIFVV